MKSGRITGGTWRGRKLIFPESDAVRPTMDKTRLAMMNIASSRIAIDGIVVLDGFCGSGALGLESLSRGAVHAVFMDASKTALSCTRQNAEALEAGERITILPRRLDRTGFARPDNIEPARLFFLDPPYNQNLIPPALSHLADENWLAADALGLIEAGKKEEITLPAGFALEDQKHYGQTQVLIVQRTPL